MTPQPRRSLIVVSVLAVGAASDALGGVWTSALNGVLTLVVIAGAALLPLLGWALVVALVGGVRAPS